MGEAIAVDGGSPPSVQIMFSALDEEKQGDCALPPEEGEGLQVAAGGRPGEPPPPLCKPLKIYPPLSDLRRPPPPKLAPPRAQEFPTLPPKPPRTLPNAEKDRDFFNKGAFKTDAYTPWGKKIREKEKKIIIKRILHIKKCLSYGQMGHFCRQCPAKQRQQAVPINPR